MRGSVQEEPHLCHVAVVIQGAQVVEQLQRSHQGLWGRRVHEVKVYLHARTQSAVSGRSTSMRQILPVVLECAHILWVVVLSSSPQASVRGMFLNHRALSSPVLHMCLKPPRVSKKA